MFFDDLHILRTIDRCEREGLTGALSDGLHLLQEVLASPHPIHDIDACTSFIKELELAERAGLLVYTVTRTGGNIAPPSINSMGANNYLGYLRDFQLTPFGHLSFPPGMSRYGARVSSTPSTTIFHVPASW